MLMEEIKMLEDSIDKPGGNGQLLNSITELKLKELSDLKQMDNSLYGKLNKVIFEILIQLQQAKKRYSKS